MFIKRLIDIVLSAIALVILAIPFFIVAILIKLDSKGPVFFRQERVGMGERRFRVWKFRSMVEDAESHELGAFTTSSDPRITKLGHMLRRTGLDELPQLLNVFLGQMSLVGPRPTLSYQVEKYDDEQMKRLSMKPGVTGWSLIKGRNSLTWPEKIKYDIWYVENWSLWLDIKILFKTPFVIIKGEGLFLEKQDEILSNNSETQENVETAESSDDTSPQSH